MTDHTSRLYMTEEGISELEDITTEASKMENIGETTTKQNIQNRISKNCGIVTKMYCRQSGNPQRKPGTEAISEAAVARISPS